MSARILVVDDLMPNIRLLQTKLEGEYYDVLTAKSGAAAIAIAQKERLDLILMDAMMPGMNGFEACQLLKQNPTTWHIPVIMVTALEEIKDRIRGLEAGADDFITKPIDDFNLLTRVRSLLRLKMVTDQLLSHTGRTIANSRKLIEKIQERKGRILVVDDQPTRIKKLCDPLEERYQLEVVSDPKEAIAYARKNIDLIIISLLATGFDGLRLCASMCIRTGSGEIPILVVGDPEDESRLLQAYDIGINDTLMRPIDPQELVARVNTQIKRKFYADSLRDDFNENLEMVVTDTLTGLGNRRYFNQSIDPLFAQLNDKGEAFSLIIFDIDHFKRVNDILGHDVGDIVLKEVAARMATHMRAIDIISRYGGEEFLIAMPRTNEIKAFQAADRVREMIANSPIYVDGQAFHVSLSAGVTEVHQGEKFSDAFKRADSALYNSKHNGRNRVTCVGKDKAAA